MKICPQCGAQHDKKNSWCNSCRAADMRKYRATPEGKAATRRIEAMRIVTPARIKQGNALRKKYAQTEKGKLILRVASKRYQVTHREKISQTERERRKIDPAFKIAANLRRRLRGVIGAKNSAMSTRTCIFLGCSFTEFKQHIEAQFTQGMSWENYGEWHLDHVIPLSSASDSNAAFCLNHYMNIQPMWAKYNRLKQNMSPQEWAAYTHLHQIDVTAIPSV